MSRKTSDFNSQEVVYNTLKGDPVFMPFYLDEHTQEIRSDVAIEELHYAAGTPLEDRHLTMASVYISKVYKDEIAAARVWEHLRILSYERRRNPIKEALNALSWDGMPRLDTFFADVAGVEDNEYSRAVASKTFIAAVARVMEPGCKVDSVLVLEGVQGAKKSSLLELLGAVAGERYVLTTKVQLGNKDTLQNISGAWFVLIDEFASFRKAEVDDLKAFITQRKDRFRFPYDRLPKEMARRCIFLATINNTEAKYLEDVTGGRRFWPLEVKSTVDLKKVAEIRDQVWAEAVARYKAKEDWYIDESHPELAKQFREEQAKRQTSDPWEHAVIRFIAKATREFTQDDLLEALGIAVKDRTQGDKNRVGKILTKLGIEGARKRINGGRPNVYDPAEITAERRKHLQLVNTEAARGPVSVEEESFSGHDGQK